MGLASTATIPLEAWQLDFTAEKEETVFTFTIQTDAIAQYTDYEKYCQIKKKSDIIDLQDLGVNYARDGQNASLNDAHKMWSESSFEHPIYDACPSRHRYSVLCHHNSFGDVNTGDTR